MPKSLEDLKTFLEGQGDDGKELYSVVVSAIDAEAEKGKKSKNKANSEAKGLRDQLKNMERFKTAFTSLGFDPDDEEADIDGFISNLKKPSTPPKKKKGEGSGEDDPPDFNSMDISGHPQFAELNKNFKKQSKEMQDLAKNFKEAQDKALALETANRHNKIKGVLSKKLSTEDGKPMVYGSDLLINSLINDNKVNLRDDGETVVFVRGKGEDAEEIPLDDGITELLSSRKDLVVNHQSGGSGGSGGPGIPPANQTDSDRLARLRSQATGSTFFHQGQPTAK